MRRCMPMCRRCLRLFLTYTGLFAHPWVSLHTYTGLFAVVSHEAMCAEVSAMSSPLFDSRFTRGNVSYLPQSEITRHRRLAVTGECLLLHSPLDSSLPFEYLKSPVLILRHPAFHDFFHELLLARVFQTLHPDGLACLFFVVVYRSPRQPEIRGCGSVFRD